MDDIDDHQAHLLRAIAQSISLLDSDSSAQHWADELRRLKAKIEVGDVWALRDLRATFGAAGSLNDVVLRNGPAVVLSDEERKKANRAFSNYLDKMWTDVEALSRSLDVPN